MLLTVFWLSLAGTSCIINILLGISCICIPCPQWRPQLWNVAFPRNIAFYPGKATFSHLPSTKTTEFEVKIDANVRKKQKQDIYCSYLVLFRSNKRIQRKVLLTTLRRILQFVSKNYALFKHTLV